MEQGSYNALIPLYGEPDFDAKCRDMMDLVLAECSHYFEKLPCVEDVEILRNVLYAGVWTKFDKIQLEKKKEKGE